MRHDALVQEAQPGWAAFDPCADRPGFVRSGTAILARNFECAFHRDTGWQALGGAGYEPVRQVAVDADWSALRFRKVAYIQTMLRNPAGARSEAGRSKANSQRGGR
ncbi:MAG: hypothetical protein M3Y32_12510 [Pseudomonadota bacterium]|nr:hypothetical protein [Pseudomonadota bacterium]